MVFFPQSSERYFVEKDLLDYFNYCLVFVYVFTFSFSRQGFLSVVLVVLELRDLPVSTSKSWG